MSDSTLTIVGNTTRESELRFSTGEKATAVWSNGVAVNHRKQVNGEWTEKVKFYNVVAFGTLAEGLASLGKGTRVFLQGTLQDREYEKDGETKVSTEMVIDAGGPELRWATADVTRRPKADGASAAPKRQKPDPIYGDEEPF